MSFIYKFKVVNIYDNKILGTGNFKISEKMDEIRRLEFFHEFTNGIYLGKEPFISITIWEWKDTQKLEETLKIENEQNPEKTSELENLFS